MPRSAALPAIVLGAGLLLALLALGLAVRSKALLKDAVELDCAERGVVAVATVRAAIEERLAAVVRGQRPAEAAAVWELDRTGRGVLRRDPAGAPDPDPRLLPSSPAATAGSGGWQPVVVRSPGEVWAAHWLPPEAGGGGARLVLWDLEAVQERVVRPALADPDGRYVLWLLHDTDPLRSGGLPFFPKAVVALDPPLSAFRVAVGLADLDGARRSLRLQTALLGALTLCLLLALCGGVLLSLRRERAESSQRREREELLARAAHELQTPLALLRAAAESVERGAVSDPAEVQRCLEIVAREEARLTERVRRLLRHLRREVEAGQPGDLGQEVQAAARELEPSLSAVGIALEVEDGLGPGWEAPRELIGDAVRELLGNVARHARGATRVRVRLAPASGGRAAVEVEDDGPGLPAAAADAAPGGPGRGGLGLLLVRQGLERAGGGLSAGAGPQGGARLRLEVACRRR